MKEKFKDGLSVGATVWKHDPYFRRYDRNREATQPRERFRPHIIMGETTRSWIVGHAWEGKKFPKNCANTKMRRGYLISEQEVDDMIWSSEHRYRVARAVEYTDIPTLRKIAAMIGYNEETLR